MNELLAFLVAAVATTALIPVAIAAARRFGFYDHPTGHKEHAGATPYLGGAAVLCGFALGALAAGQLDGRFGVLSACAAGLALVGTLDDRIPVRPRWRVLAEVGVAIVLDATGHGWTIFAWDPANLLLTIVWVVGLVNAFNLMDNLDGAGATVAGVASAGIGGVGLVDGDFALAAFAFAVCGACVGFLPYNLARPARIFLGDGGSMPLGLLVAGTAIAACDQNGLGGTAVLAAGLLAGLAILDTTLVVVSRRRAGVPLVTPGRDHLTHRLLGRLGSARRVAAVLGVGQAAMAGLAVAAIESGPVAVAIASAAGVGVGLACLFVLESDLWRPVRPTVAAPAHDAVLRGERAYGPAASADTG